MLVFYVTWFDVLWCYVTWCAVMLRYIMLGYVRLCYVCIHACMLYNHRMHHRWKQTMYIYICIFINNVYIYIYNINNTCKTSVMFFGWFPPLLLGSCRPPTSCQIPYLSAHCSGVRHALNVISPWPWSTSGMTPQAKHEDMNSSGARTSDMYSGEIEPTPVGIKKKGETHLQHWKGFSQDTVG